LDTAYPFGTYTTSIGDNSTGAAQIVSMSHTTDAFSASIPALAPATFTGMQAMNARNAFTFSFNSFIIGSIATESDVFFTITNVASNQVVFSKNFLPSATTSVLMPANTLLPGVAYRVSLDFSNRIVGKSGTTRTDLGFDLFTNATFTAGL